MNHRFHDADYVKSYAESINGRRPERIQVFQSAADLVGELPFPRSHVVELCIGSGMLGEVLLTRLPDITYEGVDFSQPMLDLAREALVSFADRIDLHQSDLNTDEWARLLRRPVHAIVSNMALHDLGTKESVVKTYREAFRVLERGGVIFNADLVKPADSDSGTGSRLKVAEHIDALESIGFLDVVSTLDLGGYVGVVGRKAGD